MSKKLRGKKLFAVAPFHLYLQLKGWEESKIVMRFWLISILFSVFGLMLAFLK
jgi:phospho-N-acetylmuramoyl-pentapeptide-transferase